MKKNLFSRKKTMNSSNQKLFCDSTEIKDYISKWCNKGGWKYSDFSTFLHLIGFEFPIILCDWNKKSNSFKCITTSNKEFIFCLLSSDSLEISDLQILIVNEEERRKYFVECKKGNSTPKVNLFHKIFFSNDRRVDSFYCDCFYHWIFKFDDFHKLQIEINEPYHESFSKTILENSDNLQNYLLTLDSSFKISDIYNKLFGLLNLSNKEFSKSPEIDISYYEIFAENNEEVLKSRILLKFGKLSEYVQSIDDETFHLYKNGNWKFYSSVVSVEYDKKQDDFVFSISGKEMYITKINLDELFFTIKRKIATIEKSIKW